MPGRAVRHAHDGGIAVAVQVDVDAAARWRMADGIGEQVTQHDAERGRLGADDYPLQALESQIDVAGRRQRQEVGDTVPGDLVKRYRGRRRGLGVVAGEGQELLEQVGDPSNSLGKHVQPFAAGRRQVDPVEVFAWKLRAAMGVRKLVRGIGDEASPVVHHRGDAPEQPVDRGYEGPEFGRHARQGQRAERIGVLAVETVRQALHRTQRSIYDDRHQQRQARNERGQRQHRAHRGAEGRIFADVCWLAYGHATAVGARVHEQPPVLAAVRDGGEDRREDRVADPQAPTCRPGLGLPNP